jgi:hypothetical protein
MNRKAEYPKLDLDLLQTGIDFDLTAVKRGDMDLISRGTSFGWHIHWLFSIESVNALPELFVGEIHNKKRVPSFLDI